MLSPLALRVPIMADEPPLHFASRLAARNFLTARPFAGDMGFNFDDVGNACPSALQRLSEISDVPVASLSENAIRRCGTTFFVKNQKLDIYSFRRRHISVCPECLKSDIEGSSLPPSSAMYGRIHWMLDSITTCERHNLSLVTVVDNLCARDRQDWSKVVPRSISDLDKLAERAVHRQPSQLEIYLANRLRGGPTNSWLDNLEFFAAEQTARLFGSVAMFGSGAAAFKLSPEEKYFADEAGFAIVRDGAEGIFDFLSTMKQEHAKNRASDRKAVGPATVYDRIYRRLAVHATDPEFDLVRNIVTDHALSNFPVGPGDTILGTPVTARRFHCIRTIAKEYAIGERRAKSVLHAEGLLVHRGRQPDTALIDVKVIERLMNHELHSMSLVQAEKRLNVPEALMKTLVDDGFIPRHVMGSGKASDRYLIEDLDNFLGRLFIDAVPLDEDADDMLNLSGVSARIRCKVSVLLQFILDRKIPRVRRRPDIDGVQSLFLDPEDVRPLLNRPAQGGLSAREAGQCLRIDPVILRRLADRGLIVPHSVLDPLTGNTKKVYPPSELDRFSSEYVSLFSFSRSLKTNTVKAKRDLTRRGVTPAKEAIGVGATFYRRSELKPGN